MIKGKTSQKRENQVRISALCRSGIGVVLTVAFLATWLPCFLRNGLLGLSCLASPAVNLFAQTLPVGCLVASTVLLLVRPLRLSKVLFMRATLVGAAGVYAGGFALLVIALVLASPLIAGLAGFAAGLGIVPLAVWWCSQVKALDFSALLLRGSGVGLGVLLLMLALRFLSALACACCWLVIAVALLGWTIACMQTATSVVEVEQEAGREPGKLSELLSARSAFSVIATSAIGLMPFVLLSDVLQGVSLSGFTFNAATGLLIGSALIFVLAYLSQGNKPIAPTLFWVVFPLCAGVLVVLVSFPKETPISTLSAGLAYAYFSMIGVFAVACVAQVVAQKEFPSVTVATPPFLLASLAAVIASVLSGFVTDGEIAGAIIMVITMVYFVFLMLAPGFQLRRILRDEDRVEETASPTPGVNFDHICLVLVERFGLSKREGEVFRYLVKGYTSPYIAKALFVSDSTVRSHTKSIILSRDPRCWCWR